MARQSSRPQSPWTILVVDDQEETLDSVRCLLVREGHRVLTASSGEQALRILAGAEVQVLIVDYMMPRMNGAELVREVRKRDAIIQIILQTGYAGQRPPRIMLSELDIQGYHDKSDEPDRLLIWVDVALKAFQLLKAARDRERLHAELVANCSHEFRTPLNIILGWTEMLIDGDLGPQTEEATRSIRSIHRAARGLTGLVVDYLQHAKLEAGMSAVVCEPISFAALAEEMQDLAGTLLSTKDVEFSTHMEDAPRHVLADPVKLETIVRNLITNAAKFTQSGRIELSIRGRDDTVQIDVRDTGCGISPEDCQIVFEAFRQVGDSSRASHTGIGLGLALSRRLARLMGGDLLVESELGRGSVFKVILPLDPAAVGRAEPIALAG